MSDKLVVEIEISRMLQHLGVANEAGTEVFIDSLTKHFENAISIGLIPKDYGRDALAFDVALVSARAYPMSKEVH